MGRSRAVAVQEVNRSFRTLRTRLRALWHALRTEPPRRDIARDLLLVFTVALAVRLIWALIVPPWQAPDEPDHYTYVAHIAERASIPHPPFSDASPYPIELIESEQQTFLTRLSSTVARTDVPDLPFVPVGYNYAPVRAYEGGPADRLALSGGRTTPYPPLYYLIMAIPYKLFQHAPIIARLFAVRAGSAALGALACVFGYLFAYELRRTRWWGRSLGLCMALLPMFAFISATVNNDAAMDLGAAILFWLLARMHRRGAISTRLALAVGLTSGLSLLSKPGALPLVAAVGVYMLIRAFPLLRAPLALSRPRLGILGCYALGGVVGYGPWVLFRLFYYHDLSAEVGALTTVFRNLTGMIQVAAATSATDHPAPVLASLRGSFSFIDYLRHEKSLGREYFNWLFVETTTGYFGWLDVTLPARAYRAVVGCGIIGVIGLVARTVMQRRERSTLLLLGAMIVGQVGFLFVIVDYYLSFARNGQTLGLQGRYFYPVLAPTLFLLLSGWEFLFRDRAIALRLAPFAMLALQLVGIAVMFARYYGVVIG